MKKWQFSLVVSILFLVLAKLSSGFISFLDAVAALLNIIVGLAQLIINE